ncbi:MAG: hypothetical protein HFE76_08155 [Firmicutes bacterium]|nr:hypothetical protein [Bacillota bacterium]
MNEALKKELERYDWNPDYGLLPQNQDVIKAHETYNSMINTLRERKDPAWRQWDDAIAETEVAHERQGFLRGYEYCLTMLGLNHENALSQQDA